MRDLLNKYFPGTFDFLKGFFEAMNNKSTGHSLRKWLAVGFFWVFAKLTLAETTPETLVPVLGVIAGLITALVITYTAGNIQEKKINAPLIPKPTADEEEPKI